MHPRPIRCLLAASAIAAFCFLHDAAAQHAVEVVSYDPGLEPADGFVNSAAALGEPTRFTGEGVFPGAVTPFNPPYLTTEIVSLGEGGHLTLRLSHYAIPQPDSPEIGVFAHAGLIDVNYPNGEAGSPAGTFGVDSAMVEVSENGSGWESLGVVTFDLPTNGYTDLTAAASSTPGSLPSDFQQPFTGTLADFSGLPYFDTDGGPDMLELLNGSGGGTWLDISSTGLAQVGYVRFSVTDDGSDSTRLNFELDAVSIAHEAVGLATVPEPTTITLALFALILIALDRCQPSRTAARYHPN